MLITWWVQAMTLTNRHAVRTLLASAKHISTVECRRRWHATSCTLVPSCTLHDATGKRIYAAIPCPAVSLLSGKMCIINFMFNKLSKKRMNNISDNNILIRNNNKRMFFKKNLKTCFKCLETAVVKLQMLII